MPRKKSLTGFTLIELLVVIAIIAILAVVVVLVLNPAALLQQGRDSDRMSDMNTLTTALNLYNEDQGGTSGYSLGTPGVIYVSVPDPTATTTAGTNCAGLGLSGSNYHCPASSTYRNANGTGWIPINFTSSTVGSPLSALPVDPVNTTSSRQYYEYETNGTAFQIKSEPESQKYVPVGGVSFSGGSSQGLLGSFGVTFTTSTYPVGSTPSILAFDSHTNTVWVANGGTNNVTQFNDTTFASSSYFMGAGSGPYGIAFDSHTNTLWVANSSYSGNNSVMQINDTTFATSSYNGGQFPNPITFDSHTNTLWTGWESNIVTQINDTTFATSSYTLPSFVENIAFDSHTNTLWFTDYGTNALTQMNDTTFATSSYPIGSSPDGIAFDSHTNTLWVAVGTGLTQINDTTYATSSYSMGGGSSPDGVAFDSHTDSIWGTNESGNTVMQINDTTYATTTYNVPSFPNGIVFDSHTNAIWVSNESGAMVTVFTPNR